MLLIIVYLIRRIMEEERTIPSKIYFELSKQFPDHEGAPCYPYNIIIDADSYDQKIFHELEEIGFGIGGIYTTRVKYPFPNLLVYAIGMDDAYLITDKPFDLTPFDPKYHKLLEQTRYMVMTYEEFMKKYDNKELWFSVFDKRHFEEDKKAE